MKFQNKGSVYSTFSRILFKVVVMATYSFSVFIMVSLDPSTLFKASTTPSLLLTLQDSVRRGTRVKGEKEKACKEKPIMRLSINNY